jgi:predicted component of type VI protein secretion system
MASLRRTLHDALMLDPERLTVQMLSRVGYSVPARPSVRRPLSALLTS